MLKEQLNYKLKIYKNFKNNLSKLYLANLCNHKTNAKAALLPCVYLEVKCPETFKWMSLLSEELNWKKKLFNEGFLKKLTLAEKMIYQVQTMHSPKSPLK